jgi:transcriptional regulator with XRE-family HTH domain
VNGAASYDGPTLRAVRESMDVPLRRIARTGGMSHGHLSKVERGEHGRPVTPAIVAAYERATGVKLAEAAARVAGDRQRQTGRGRTWSPGTLTDLRRRAYNAAVAAIAVGGHLGEPVGRLIDACGRPGPPSPPEGADLAQLEQVAQLLTGLDLRHGGGLAGQLAKTVLRWAAPMLDMPDMDPAEHRRLHSVFGALAHRAGWAAFDVAAHEAARSLFRLALYAAAVAGDHNLRAHVLADVAAQHNQLGYRQDALEIVRLAEGDDRIAPAVRMVLHGVKARTYAAAGQASACHRQVELADAACAAAAAAGGDEPGWVGRLAGPARLYAATGHALAELYAATGAEDDRREARHRLGRAIEELDAETHTRAYVLCVSQLALLLATSTDPQEAAGWSSWVRQVLPPGGSVRSSRVDAAAGTARQTPPDPPAAGGSGQDITGAAG